MKPPPPTAARSAPADSVRTAVTACILCSRNCGLAVEVSADNFLGIRGDVDHPVSKGYICQKAARLAHYQQNADRLSRPLQRQADGSFVAVSWDAALDDIAARLLAIRAAHGGDAFAFVGGGGQGNHLGGGAYGASQLRSAMGSYNLYNSLGQEKTGDFWVNGRMFGRQDCHTTEDVEHAEVLLCIGANPFAAHGFVNARDVLRAFRRDANRQLFVIDPRRTETVGYADVHLQLRPGTDAFLLAAMLAILVRDGLCDKAFLAEHCEGYGEVEAQLRAVPIADYVARADVAMADVVRVTHAFAKARTACVRVDLGIQHTLHCTLNGYLEKLLYLLTGHFGKAGGNNLHSLFLPVISHTDERNPRIRRTAHHKMFPIAGILPPAILPDEILQPGPRRIRAAFVDSCNPALTWPDSAAQEQAFAALDLLVVVDVALTETARLAHYVLPAASQYEKFEATGFNLEFPANAFHLRHPLFSPPEGCLAEPEIYTRLLEKMGVLPARFPLLTALAAREPAGSGHLAYLTALAALLVRRRDLIPYAASILYRTLGPHLPDGAAAAAPLLPLAVQYAQKHPQAVRRAGIAGSRLTLGSALFAAILQRRSGTLISVHEYADVWGLVAHSNRKIVLPIAEMFAELAALTTASPPNPAFPLLLAAGERRGYNANQVFRDPAWRRTDAHGALRLHPADAAAIGLASGEAATCTSARGAIDVVVEVDDSVRPGVVTLPHGYGARYAGGRPHGPAINRLTDAAACDPLSRTPYHKYVAVRLEKQASAQPRSEGVVR